MKKLITYIIFFQSILGFSQTIGDYKMDIEFSTQDIDSLVAKTENFIDNKTASIELIKISPKCETLWIFNDSGTKTTEEKCHYETIIKKDSIENKKRKVELEERFIENKTEIKKSDFVNFLKTLYGQKLNLEDYSIDSCYVPRHGISFYDSDKKMIGFFEICFECRNYKIIGEIPRMILLSDAKFEKLSQIFNKYGMTQ